MSTKIRQAAIVFAVSLSSLVAVPSGSAEMVAGPSDSGSAAFDRYVLDVRERMQSIKYGNYWVSTLVDEQAMVRYLAAIGDGAGGPGLNDTANHLASLDVQPLRTFNSYLSYLGQRMRVDAGPAGPLLGNDKGTMTFDRYVEEINYRIQMQYRADQTF